MRPRMTYPTTIVCRARFSTRGLLGRRLLPSLALWKATLNLAGRRLQPCRPVDQRRGIRRGNIPDTPLTSSF